MATLMISTAAAGGCGASHAAGAPGLETVVLATDFTPNVEFAPYYVAQSEGYYREAGLNVVIDNGSDPDLMERVANGKYTFAVSGGDSAVVAAAAGIHVKYVMAQYQKYPIGAMTLRRGGPHLTSPSQLAGLTVGVSAPGSETDYGLDALLVAGGLTPKSVKVVSIGFSETEALATGKVQVAMTYADNEPVEAAAEGYATNVLPVARYDALTSNGIVTGAATLAGHATEVRRFVTASLKGLAFTLAHPAAAFTICREHIPTLTGTQQLQEQRKVLAARLTFQQPPAGHPLGWSSPEGWARTVRLLRSVGAIRTGVQPSEVFTNSIVDAVDVHAG